MWISGYINSPDDMLLGISTYKGVEETGRDFKAFAIGIFFFTIEFCWDKTI
jgi:hypothetical protein